MPLPKTGIAPTTKPPVSFEGRTAVVINDNLHILGGGERTTLAVGKALKQLGFNTVIVSTQELPLKEKVAELFGDEFADLPLRRIPPDDPFNYLRSMKIDVFVNHSFMSVLPNPGQLGLYWSMFPVDVIRTAEKPQQARDLFSYHRVVCNSTFTRRHVGLRWDYLPERTRVLHPPIGRAALGAASRVFPRLWRKRRQLVNTGRFNPGMHNKNQAMLAEAFLEARARTPALKDWSIVFVGHPNPDEESRQYFAQCQRIADGSGGAVRLEPDATSARLLQLLRESFGYVHGTGAFLPHDEHPEWCEHFGIAIVEAMASGCLPLVYREGGIFDVLTPGVNGFAYGTRDELLDGFARMAALRGTREAGTMRFKAVETAKTMGQMAFTRGIDDILRDAIREFGLFAPPQPT